jgi:hypothetical protein
MVFFCGFEVILVRNCSFLPVYSKRPNGLRSSDQMLQLIDSQHLHNHHNSMRVLIDPQVKKVMKKQVIHLHNYRFLANKVLKPTNVN